MAYLLRGGPRDRQLVDDLPRGYRPVHDTARAAGARIDEIEIDAAVWAPDRPSAEDRPAGASPPRLTAL